MQEELFNLTSGIYEMSGIDIYTNPENDANGYLIELNGITYFFEEDPSDGYRSFTFGGIDNSRKCQYRFAKQKVEVKVIKEDLFEGIYIFDLVTKELVVKIGTASYDAYYPMAIMEYYPENFAINQTEDNQYNTWIDCTEDNYWRSDYDIVAFKVNNEMYIMSKNECHHGWSNLVRLGAKFMTPSNPFKS